MAISDDPLITVLYHPSLILRQSLQQAVVAEWLRRLTRNQFPSGSVGSNPTDCEIFSALVIYVVEVKSSISIS